MNEAKVLYLVLLYMLLFASGAALAAVVMAAKNRFRRWWAYAGVKVGLLVTNGILFWRLAPAGEVPVDGYAVGYTAGMLLTAVMLCFVAGDMARRGGAVANKKEGKE